MAATVAEQNTTTTVVADFVISTLSSLLLTLLSYSVEVVKLTLYLATHLLKYSASAIDDLYACLDEMFPPGRMIQAVRHYLITKSNAWEPVVKGYLGYLLAKCDEIYPLMKQYLLNKLAESIQFLGWCFEHLINRFHDAFPPEEAMEALYKYMEAGKQYMAITAEDWMVGLKGFAGYVMHKFNESFLAEEAAVVALNRWWQTAKLLVVVFTLVCISLLCCKKYCYGRSSRTMKAPGKDGVRMRRRDFERDPRGYFRNLRSHN